MNVLFIYSLYNFAISSTDISSTDKPIKSYELIYFGISYISSFLKKHGHSTKLIVLNRMARKRNKKIIDEYITKFKPKIIVFTAVSTEYNFITTIAKYVREYFPDIYLLIGGPHVTLNPEGVLENFDALCVGEGEIAILQLVSQLEKNINPSKIRNLWIRHGSKIEKNPTQPFLQNLDILPFPDREMWKEWIENPNARYSILLGRGCPFECTYCCNHALKKVASGLYVRYRSPENIIKEIREILKQNTNINEIYFEVETIGVNKKWLIDLCDKLQHFNMTLKKPLFFGVNIRITPNMDFMEIFQNLKKSNFRFINIGLESGSERVRREILNRNYSNEDIVDAVTLARENGLQVSFFNLIGIPGETLSDFKETIEMNRKCLPDWLMNYIFYPYPGTKLFDLCEKQGLLKQSLSTDIERRRSIFDMPFFRKKQIERGYIWFEYLVYKGHKPTYELLLKQYFRIP